MKVTPRTDARDERHRRALAQTIEWAREAAAAGHDREAIAWLRMLEAVEGRLPAELAGLFERCLANIAAATPTELERRRRLAA